MVEASTIILKTSVILIFVCLSIVWNFHHPKEALDQVNKILSDDGLLYVEVPDYVEAVKDWQDALYLAHIRIFQNIIW